MDYNTLKSIFEGESNILLQIHSDDLLHLSDLIIEQTRQSTIEECERKAKYEVATLTATEVCEILKVNKTTLWRWNKNGVLPHNKVGKKRLYRQSEIDRLLTLRKDGACA
ncbi:MAG: helix-turn-helix domain-containing protein [Rikenellaceae bacterium]